MIRLISSRLGLIAGKMGILNPKILIRDSFIYLRPIYGFLLILWFPWLILALLTFAIPKNLAIIISSLYFFSLDNLVWGGAIFFVYQKLNGEEVTLFQSLQKALEKFSSLIFARILLFGFILYICPRLYFVPYLVVVENYPITDVFKRCWQITRGYGWQIFWNYLIIPTFVPNILSFLSSLITGSIFGVSVWDLNRNKYFITEPPFAFDRLLTIAIYFFLFYPFFRVYFVLMFAKILNSKKRKLDLVAR